MRNLLPNWIRLHTLTEIGFNQEIEETGSSFSENALIKARTVYEKTGRTVFSDDSGLEVQILGGIPGVNTARYAGLRASADQNIDKLLGAMAGAVDRKARFVCCIALVINDKEYLFEDYVTGMIGELRSGVHGFGYDPIFIPDGYQHSFAELSDMVKNQISHRGKAVRRMVDWIATHKAV